MTWIPSIGLLLRFFGVGDTVEGGVGGSWKLKGARVRARGGTAGVGVGV